MTNAYILVSDLHLTYKNFRNRIDYIGEMEDVKLAIEDIANRYKLNGCNIIIIFMGDIFHNSYNDVFTAVQDNNWFHKLKDLGYQLFSVVGNHELSYYKSNPFYTLLKDIQSEKLMYSLKGTWKLRGNKNILHVVDEITDGEVTFYFNHYGTKVSYPTSDVSIGLFHQEYIPNQVLSDMQFMFDKSIYTGYENLEITSIIDQYNFCFFGHMHQTYGIYESDSGTTLCYLGSLGRTNIAEVNNNFLERNLPCVIISDGEFQGIESNKIQLRDYDNSVIKNIVIENKEKYELQKQRMSIRGTDVFNRDITNSIYEILKDDIRAIDIFTKLNNNESLNYLRELEEDLRNV